MAIAKHFLDKIISLSDNDGYQTPTKILDKHVIAKDYYNEKIRNSGF